MPNEILNFSVNSKQTLKYLKNLIFCLNVEAWFIQNRTWVKSHACVPLRIDSQKYREISQAFLRSSSRFFSSEQPVYEWKRKFIWYFIFSPSVSTRAHSFGQFKKYTLLKARTQSQCFSYPGLARAFQSAGSADLLSFGGVSVGCGARLTVLVAGFWSSENAAGLFANCHSQRLL